MWTGDCKSFADRHRLSARAAADLKCTAEHVVAKCDGGSNATSNIVAACRRCNFLRHNRKVPKGAQQYQAYVQGRVARGGWHNDAVRKALASLL
jgi:5-methylcytosine-specific restriction endonuclease McrA